jgi:hypothetical protein
MEENPHLKKRDKGGFDCEVSRCHRLEFLNELLSHDPTSNFINDRAHFKADSNPNPTKTHGVLAVGEGGETGSRGHLSVQVA